MFLFFGVLGLLMSDQHSLQNMCKMDNHKIIGHNGFDL